ncbi:MAG: MGH1-like glycoside hydrolase domain-containing protein, partial [Anaerolineae bacterium]
RGLVETGATVPAGKDLAEMVVPIGKVAAGTHELTIVSGGGAAIELDGFAICESADVANVAFETVTWQPVPDLAPGPTSSTLRLSYRDLPLCYGVAWDGTFRSQVRELYTDDLDCFMRRTVHDHVRTVLRDRWGPADGNPRPPRQHFTDVFLRPITVEAHSLVTIYGLVGCGSEQQVEEMLGNWDCSPDACQAMYEQVRASAVKLDGHEAGQRYRASQERMAATTLTNVVFPVCIKRTYVRHNTPGRWWDSLYTWDSGFIGLGLAELDVDRAIDCLNAYVTEPGDRHAAFVHHGSPVPVQFYLFLEIWNRRQDRALLEHFYPRLRQYYAFLSGHLGSSTTRTLESNLLKTWDYFYNSGGWDDYPPQVYVHQHGLEDRVAPVVTTAHCIRAARILSMMARALGQQEDLAGYEGDIALFQRALQEHAWDPQSGYYSYVVHDGAGRPVGHLMHESGVNYNQGLDGAYPLVAGICTPQQEERLFAHLQSPQRHWTPIGLSTVDTSAPYFRPDGYWNGAVWMPHQWFYWKTCLDLGRPGFARQIAEAGLEVWRREVDASYNCCEHFIIATGRGAGWHQFSGLSTPVLSWYAAYYRAGRLTTGFDVWTRHVQWGTDSRSLDAELVTYGQRGRSLYVIASLAADRHYRVTWNDVPRMAHNVRSGALEIELPCGQEGRLLVAPID